MKKLCELFNNCYLVTDQFWLAGFPIKKGSIAFLESGILYFCDSFPKKYAGSMARLILRVNCYDGDTRVITADIMRGNTVTYALYSGWIKAGRPTAQKFKRDLGMRDYEHMMDHDRKKKRGTGGVRLSAKSDEYTTDSVHYKQVTECAYWENLNNSKSGNASVVASWIR